MIHELDTHLKKEQAPSLEDLRLKKRLSEAAQHWNRLKKPDYLLWRAKELDSLRDFYARYRDDMTVLQLVFFDASVRKQWQTQTTKKFTITTLVILALVFGIGTYWFIKLSQAINEADQAQLVAQQQREIAQQARSKAEEAEHQAQKAEQQAQKAEQKTRQAEQQAKAAQRYAEEQRNKALISQSLLLVERAKQATEKGDVTTGILLALEALPNSMSAPNKPIVAEALIQLYEAVSQLENATLVLTGHEGSVRYAEFSPDGQRIITASADKTARLWDANTGKQLAVLGNHKSAVEYAKFSQDGKQVVTSTKNKMGRVWDANTGQQTALLKICRINPRTSKSMRRSIKRKFYYNPLLFSLNLLFICGDSEVTHAEFDSEGKQVVPAFSNKTTQLNKVINSSQRSEVLKEYILSKAHKGKVTYAALSPDGQTLVTTSEDKTARRWRIFSTAQALIDYARERVAQK